MTPKQYAQLGTTARKIVDHDRASVAMADEIARAPVVPMLAAVAIRERREERRKLSADAAFLCRRAAPIGGGQPTAVMA